MSDVTTETPNVTVSPAKFSFVEFDADEIATLVSELAAMLEIANPIRVIVDETTPLAKLSEELDGTGPEATITLHAESGALEDRQHPMSFSVTNASESFGRILFAPTTGFDRISPTPRRISISRWRRTRPGTRTAPVGSPDSAFGSTSNGGGTTTATGSGSTTASMSRSTRCGPPTTSAGLTSSPPPAAELTPLPAVVTARAFGVSADGV